MPIKLHLVDEFNALKKGVLPEPKKIRNAGIGYTETPDYFDHFSRVAKYIKVQTATGSLEEEVTVLASKMAILSERAMTKADIILEDVGCEPEDALDVAIEKLFDDGEDDLAATFLENKNDVSWATVQKRAMVDHAINCSIANLCSQYWDKSDCKSLVQKYVQSAGKTENDTAAFREALDFTGLDPVLRVPKKPFEHN